MRRTLVAVAAIVAALALGAPALAAGSPVPTISFKPDGTGWYAVTATPPAPVKVTLTYGSDCNWLRAVCAKWEVVGTKLLPRGEVGRVSWLQASYWGQTRKNDVLAGGFYRLTLKVPGKPASLVSTAWRLAFGG